MFNRFIYKFVLSVIVTFGITGVTLAQSNTIVRGIVTDSSTGAPLQFASIYFKGGRGVISNKDGSFMLETSNMKYKRIEASYAGYKTVEYSINPGVEQSLNISLVIADDDNGVVVTSKRKIKYSNKNNPAVELIRKVLEHRDENRMSGYDALQYELYEKMIVSLTEKPKIAEKKMLNKFSFVFDGEDTTSFEGKKLIPMYMEEKLSDIYRQKDPTRKKEYIKGEKKVNLGEFIDSRGVSQYLSRMYEDVDIYQGSISLMSNQFLSPISQLAPTFYQFYIRDTIEENGQQFVKLYFTPRNTNDLLFRGTMYITTDGRYAVAKVDMTVSKNINLNWVKDLKISQRFQKTDNDKFILTQSNVLAEFALTKGSKGSIVGERSLSFKDILIDKPAPDSVFKGQEVVVVENDQSQTESYWNENRHVPLSTAQSQVYANIDSLQKMPSFRRIMDWATVLLAGYKAFGPVEVGPVNAFYSFNPVEGFRGRLGGRTTPKFSESLYFEGYLAYGFKDEKFKYSGSASYSFNKKSIYTFPQNFVRATYQFDTQIPGQELQFVSEDNFLLSFKRGVNDKWLYNRTSKFEYINEFGKGLRYTLMFKHTEQTPALVDSNGIAKSGGIRYLNVHGVDTSFINNLTTSEVSLELRWAPREQFYQGKTYRTPIFNKYPIFTLGVTKGFKGVFGSDYNYTKLNFRMFKRFYLTTLGYSDVVIEGAKVFGTVPFPLLSVHRANQTYAYQLNSYNLMNFMEFVSDQSVAVNIDHNFGGFIFNKIPLLKKLKLREVASFKMLYGSLSDKNNPVSNNDLMPFPFTYQKTGSTVTGLERNTYGLGTTPYIEASVGIANIFKLFRVDAVRRFTYLDNPNVPEWGIRARVKFDF